MKPPSFHDILFKQDIRETLTLQQLQDLFQRLKSIPSVSGMSKWPTPAAMAMDLSARFLRPTDRWKPADHLIMLSDKLARLAKGEAETPYLMVSMPPRFGKSLLCSFWFPLWVLSRKPQTHVIMCTYSDNYASFWGRKARNFIIDYGEELGLELRKDTKASDEWEVTEGGGMLAAGLRGGVTGRGTTCCIIDDAVKDEIEAASETIRDTIFDQWQSTVFPRIEPGGCCVVIGTRWHQDDLLGRLEAKSRSGVGLNWDIINLPALAEEDDPLGRDIGESLWPQKRSLAYLEDKKLGMSPYLWGALYQGHPTPEGGGAIKRAWWKTWDALPDRFDQVIMSWDLAFKDLKKSDYTVGQVWGRKDASFYLLDQVRDRLDAPATMGAFRSLCAKWPNATFKMIEDAANGPAVFQMLRHEIHGIVLWPPKGQRRSSKDERISAVAPLIQAGNVYLPNSEICPWVHDFIEEHAAFPHGANDDCVDATSQALGYLRHGAATAISRDWDSAVVGMGAPTTTQEIMQRSFQKFIKKKRDEHAKQFDRDHRPPMLAPRRLGNW